MDWRTAAFVGILVGAGPVAAQSPIAITSRIETGWTSNATDSAAGSADFYATHSQEATLMGATDNFVLRGSLAIGQTRFMQTTFEDDDEVSGSLEMEMELGDAAVLRLGYGVARSWSGDDLSIGGLAIPIRGDEIHHTYAAELVVAGADQQVTVGVDADQILPGDTVLVGFGLPPVRLAPEVGSVAVRVSWERALTPSLAVLAGLEGWFTTVPEAQQLTFLRVPADGGRVALGLRMLAGIVSLEASGGLDAVWPKGGTALLRSAPHFAITGGLTPIPELTLALKTETGVELVDPLDGVAGRTGAVELSAALALRPELTLSAKLSHAWETGLLDTSVSQSMRMASLVASLAVSDRLAYEATLSWSRHNNPFERYDKTGISVSLSGAI